jgi:hypothetical protein
MPTRLLARTRWQKRAIDTPRSNGRPAATQREWQVIRLAVLLRARFRCQACQQRSALDVHHIVKRAQGGSDFDLDRLVALCRGCHDLTDAPYNKGRLVITPLGDGVFRVDRWWPTASRSARRDFHDVRGALDVRARHLHFVVVLLRADPKHAGGPVHGRSGALADAVAGEVNRFRSLSAVALRLTKRAVRETLGLPFDEGLAVLEDLYRHTLMTTADAEEGLRAFVEHRKPIWRDR